MITVVEVGPVTVRGPGVAAPQRIRQAIDCIDDPITLLDERPLRVSRLWTDVLDAAAAGGGGASSGTSLESLGTRNSQVLVKNV